MKNVKDIVGHLDSLQRKRKVYDLLKFRLVSMIDDMDPQRPLPADVEVDDAIAVLDDIDSICEAMDKERSRFLELEIEGDSLLPTDPIEAARVRQTAS